MFVCVLSAVFMLFTCTQLFGNRLIETIMGLVLFTIVAFVTSWSTSVLVLLLSPLLILVAVLRVYVVITSSSVIKGSLEKSGKVRYIVVVSIMNNY